MSKVEIHTNFYWNVDGDRDEKKNPVSPYLKITTKRGIKSTLVF